MLKLMTSCKYVGFPQFQKKKEYVSFVKKDVLKQKNQIKVYICVDILTPAFITFFTLIQKHKKKNTWFCHKYFRLSYSYYKTTVSLILIHTKTILCNRILNVFHYISSKLLRKKKLIFFFLESPIYLFLYYFLHMLRKPKTCSLVKH